MTSLESKRILIVEDEYFIATDLTLALQKAGAEVVGPVGDLAQGLKLVDPSLDAAVLDINLDGATSFPIADALDRAGVPRIFITGYDTWALPERYREQPRIGKPVAMSSVVAAVEQLLTVETTR